MLRASRVILLLAAALVAALVVLVVPRQQRAVDQARERIATGSDMAHTRCGPIEYATIGEGQPLLVVHGAGGGFDQGLDLGAPLAGHGFRVIAMSRFGYLRTPLPADASAQAQADAHACLLDALAIPRAAILGVSAGAPSSMQFALRHPERAAALVLVVPAAFVPRPGEERSLKAPAATELVFNTALRSDLLFSVAIEHARATLVEAILATPRSVVDHASAEEQARVEQLLHHILPVSARRLGLLNDARIVSAIERYELERIEAPTLVVSAKDDLFGTFDSARYTAEHVRGARFLGYPSGGHVLVGRQHEMSEEIAKFLEQALARADHPDRTDLPDASDDPKPESRSHAGDRPRSHRLAGRSDMPGPEP